MFKKRHLLAALTVLWDAEAVLKLLSKCLHTWHASSGACLLPYLHAGHCISFGEASDAPVPNAGSAFGPDYAHQQDSAFGIYACGFDHNCQQEMHFQQVQPGSFHADAAWNLLKLCNCRQDCCNIY